MTATRIPQSHPCRQRSDPGTQSINQSIKQGTGQSVFPCSINTRAGQVPAQSGQDWTGAPSVAAQEPGRHDLDMRITGTQGKMELLLTRQGVKIG